MRKEIVAGLMLAGCAMLSAQNSEHEARNQLSPTTWCA
jgi:hypothetical protein